jgi:nascent polypeptide-associated complex subunit alpha
MRRMNPRQAKRLMEQMGMRVEELPPVKQVIIKTENKDIIIDEPEVSVTNMQGQKIYQIMGGTVSEQGLGEKEVTIAEEDVQLVAQQAKVSLEVARQALKETKGDLAQAILLLNQRGSR